MHTPSPSPSPSPTPSASLFQRTMANEATDHMAHPRSPEAGALIIPNQSPSRLYNEPHSPISEPLRQSFGKSAEEPSIINQNSFNEFIDCESSHLKPELGAKDHFSSTQEGHDAVATPNPAGLFVPRRHMTGADYTYSARPGSTPGPHTILSATPLNVLGDDQYYPGYNPYLLPAYGIPMQAASMNWASMAPPFFPVQQRTPCQWPFCNESFVRSADMNRHVQSVHMGIRHHCPSYGCPNNRGQGYCRLEKLRTHHMQKHGYPLP